MSIQFQGQIHSQDSSIFAARSHGWLGGDVATSVKLAPTRYLWLFGDTLYGNMYKDVKDNMLVSIIGHISLLTIVV